MEKIFVPMVIGATAAYLVCFQWDLRTFLEGSTRIVCEMSIDDYFYIREDYEIKGFFADELTRLQDVSKCLSLLTLAILCDGLRLIQEIHLFKVLNNAIIRIVNLFPKELISIEHAPTELMQSRKMTDFIMGLEVWNYIPFLAFAILFVGVAYFAFEFTVEYSAMITGQPSGKIRYVAYDSEGSVVEAGVINEPTFYEQACWKIETISARAYYCVLGYIIILLFGLPWPSLF